MGHHLSHAPLVGLITIERPDIVVPTEVVDRRIELGLQHLDDVGIVNPIDVTPVVGLCLIPLGQAGNLGSIRHGTSLTVGPGSYVRWRQVEVPTRVGGQAGRRAGVSRDSRDSDRGGCPPTRLPAYPP